jgi:NTP pyrophosphatase (non-canonical NTP hydrolase)
MTPDTFDIVGQIGLPATLEQLAEECTELAQAALKMARLHRGENPTPVTEQEALDHLLEEAGDVHLCLSVLGDALGGLDTSLAEAAKLRRWHERLKVST